MPSWSTHLKTFIATVLLSIAVVYLFIVLVDPYDSVPFSLPLEREPVSTNQRFAYPSLARKPNFDSAIIGTSTARLLNPERLNQLTGDSWVNLAMNSATAYEQMEMLKLFLRHHRGAKHIVIGIDDAWCRPGKALQKFTFRPFPPWMYDENRWNDLLYLFNDKALENTVRLLEYWQGKREAKYDRTGYRDFTADFGEYDLARARKKLYRSGKQDFEELPAGIDPTGSDKPYATLKLLGELIESKAGDTDITLLYMPLHAHHLVKNRTNYQACKGKLQGIAGDFVARLNILDRMQIDTLTRDDANYWDPLHFTNRVAMQLEEELSLLMQD